MKTREYESHERFLAYEELTQNPAIKNRILCFIAVPSYFVSGLAQGIWSRGINTNLPIYFDGSTFINGTSKLKEPILLKQTSNKVTLINLDPNNISFSGGGILSSPMGEITTEKAAGYKINKLTLKLNSQYQNQNMLFITWDYEKARFKVLEQTN